LPRAFFFPAKVDEIPRYARQVIEVLGEPFDKSLIMASLSEALFNGIAYGALGLPASDKDRDPVAFVQALREAESRVGPRTGLDVTVARAADDPSDWVVTIKDPGSGFDWRAKVNALADQAVSPTGDDLLDTSGRGIAIMLTGAHAVSWNDGGNQVTLRYRTPGAPAPLSNPPAPIRIDVSSDERLVSPTAVTLQAIPIARIPLKATRVDRPPAPRSPRSEPPIVAEVVKRHSRPHQANPTPLAPDPRILVVDDIEVNRRVLQHMLRWEGFDVRLASDGPSSLELMKTWRPDITVLDLNMPKMSGIEVVRAMRSLGLLRHSSVMLLTAATVDDRTRAEGLDAGACDFLEKPISRRELIARIHRRLAVQGDLRQLASERDELQENFTAAAHLMQALMPPPRIEVPAGVITSLVIPCDSLGGDVVDFVHLGDHRWMVCLLDVAGHGLSAALTASSSRGILRDRLIANRSLADSVAALNSRVSDDFDRTGQQTALVAVLVREDTGAIHIVNAGCPPAVLGMRDGTFVSVKSAAPPAGLVPDMIYPVTTFPLDEVSRVIIVSDGLTEGFGASSDSMGALKKVVGLEELSRGREIPVERVRAKVQGLGRARDDVSLAWIEFCNHRKSDES
jgi:sigma-B regulation protein RsbU (phosphoserine phosphatase)